MRIASLLCVLLILPACDTLEPDTENLGTDPSEFINVHLLSQDPDALVGTWEWVRSTYYETLSGEPATETPASTDRTEQWTFLADGTARLVVDGETKLETTYDVRRRGAGATSASLLLGSGGYGYEFGTEGDRLVLDASPVDGPQSVYQRR